MTRLILSATYVLIVLMCFAESIPAKVRFFNIEDEKEYLENVAKPVEMALIAKVISIEKGEHSSTVGYRPVRALKGHPPTEDFFLEYDNQYKEKVSIQVPEHIRLRWRDQVLPHYDIDALVYFTFRDEVRGGKHHLPTTQGRLIEDDDSYNRIIRIYEKTKKIELTIEEVVPLMRTGEYTLRCTVNNRSSAAIELINPFHSRMRGSYSWRLISNNGRVWGGKFTQDRSGGINRQNMIVEQLSPGERFEGQFSILVSERNPTEEELSIVLKVSNYPIPGRYSFYLVYYSYLDGTGTLVSDMAELIIEANR